MPGFLGMSKVALEPLRDLPLTDLGLGGCAGMGVDSLDHLSKMPLTRLNLAQGDSLGDGQSWLTDACLDRLRGLPLTDLCLWNCSRVSDFGLYLLRDAPLTKPRRLQQPQHGRPRPRPRDAAD